MLGHLHHHDWLHLDVKPANVVVDHGRAVLIDLSLAGRPGSGRAGAGTRGYLAPEQARGRDLTAATDVWGLGVTLIEAFTDDVPYGDEATWDTGRRWPLVHRPDADGARRPATSYRRRCATCWPRASTWTRPRGRAWSTYAPCWWAWSTTRRRSADAAQSAATSSSTLPTAPSSTAACAAAVCSSG